jgi:hypothetical protein
MNMRIGNAPDNCKPVEENKPAEKDVVNQAMENAKKAAIPRKRKTAVTAIKSRVDFSNEQHSALDTLQGLAISAVVSFQTSKDEPFQVCAIVHQRAITNTFGYLQGEVQKLSDAGVELLGIENSQGANPLIVIMRLSNGATFQANFVRQQGS